ncbi:hypothetical protein QOT17_009453 [Balamuthia mandrillaris]
MQRPTALLSFALLLVSFVAVAHGCTCTFASQVYLGESCGGMVVDCKNYTLTGGECISVPGQGSMFVDCLSQIAYAFNSSDCSGPQAIASTPGFCYGVAEISNMVAWNEDCEGNSVPVEESEECDPVPEPEEDEVCFVSLKLQSECSESAESMCLGNWWFNHNQCKALPAKEISVLVDCVNGIGHVFSGSTNCTGLAMSFMDDHCPPEIFPGPTLYAKWGETCDGEAREESEEEEEEEEDGSNSSSQDSGSQSEGDGSAASSLRLNILL